MKFLRPFHCRAAWPPFWLVVIFAFIYVVFNVGIWLIGRGVPDFYTRMSGTPENVQFYMAAIGTAAVLHVLYRLVRFHPACNWPYASWLFLSPWRAGQPLPLGPIHPVWQDLAVIAILSALARWQAHIDGALPLEASGLTYMIGLTLLLAATATWRSFFVMGFLWPSVLLTDGRWLAEAAILVVMAVVLWRGTWNSLGRFPWRPENRTQPGLAKPANPNSLGQIEIRIEGVNAAGTSSFVGWPLAQLSPKARFKSVSTATSFWVSLLIGWWAYCMIVASGMDSVPGLILVFGVLGAIVRVVTYLGGLLPSFSIPSRLVSGRWIVPGFDQIFVAPLLAIAAGVAGGMVTLHAGSWYPAAQAFFFALIWFILLAGGPTMRNWVLTGEHRFRPQFARGTRQAFRPI